MKTSLGLLALAGTLLIGCGEPPAIDLAELELRELGPGSCSSLAMPRVQDCPTDSFGRACVVGEGRTIRTSHPLQVVPDGCVGVVLVLPGTAVPRLDAPGAVLTAVAPRAVSGFTLGDTIPVPESDPAAVVPHHALFHEGTRRLFVRVHEPISGPMQTVVKFNLDRLFPDLARDARPIRGNGYLFRFYVGGVPSN